MAPSPYDQKKAEIVHLVEKECLAETNTAEAIFELKCLEVKEKYKAKKKLACDLLREQELEELAVMRRTHKAGMEPVKVKHEKKLSAIREQHHIVGLETGPLASALPETPSSPALAMAAVSPSSENGGDNRHKAKKRPRLADHQKAEPGQMNSISGNNSLGDSEDSDSSSNTSIPAIIPKATNEAATKTTNEAMFALVPLPAKCKRLPSTESGGGGHGDELDSSQSENEGEQDDFSDITFQNSPVRPSRKVPKASKRAPAQRFGRNIASSTPPNMMKNRPHQNKLNNGFRTWSEATSPIPHGQAGGEDGDESIYSGPG